MTLWGKVRVPRRLFQVAAQHLSKAAEHSVCCSTPSCRGQTSCRFQSRSRCEFSVHGACYGFLRPIDVRIATCVLLPTCRSDRQVQARRRLRSDSDERDQGIRRRIQRSDHLVPKPRKSSSWRRRALTHRPNFETGTIRPQTHRSFGRRSPSDPRDTRSTHTRVHKRSSCPVRPEGCEQSARKHGRRCLLRRPLEAGHLADSPRCHRSRRSIHHLVIGESSRASVGGTSSRASSCGSGHSRWDC